ncbi:MAG: hypothetical protein KGS72_28675 [Cyanobacteria bacterium REEB67]|nr:hypothetical protein [Cyanobacteria bacterium REEB67]
MSINHEVQPSADRSSDVRVNLGPENFQVARLPNLSSLGGFSEYNFARPALPLAHLDMGGGVNDSRSALPHAAHDQPRQAHHPLHEAHHQSHPADHLVHNHPHLQHAEHYHAHHGQGEAHAPDHSGGQRTYTYRVKENRSNVQYGSGTAGGDASGGRSARNYVDMNNLDFDMPATAAPRRAPYVEGREPRDLPARPAEAQAWTGRYPQGARLFDETVPGSNSWTARVLNDTIASLEGKSPQVLERGLDPRLGCARCVTQFGHRAYGLPITDSVANLESSMQARNFERVPLNAETIGQLQPGDIIVGHRNGRLNGEPLHGHTAVYKGDGQVFNNNAITKTMISESLDIFKQPLYDRSGRMHMNGYSDVWIYRPRTNVQS